MKAIILYASITGNAKGMARIEQQFFEHYGWDVTLGEMIQTDPTTIKYYGKDYNTAPELFEAVLAASGAVQGADPVKIALNVKQEEMPQFAAFTKSLIAKAEALQADK